MKKKIKQIVLRIEYFFFPRRVKNRIIGKRLSEILTKTIQDSMSLSEGGKPLKSWER